MTSVKTCVDTQSWSLQERLNRSRCCWEPGLLITPILAGVHMGDFWRIRMNYQRRQLRVTWSQAQSSCILTLAPPLPRQHLHTVLSAWWTQSYRPNVGDFCNLYRTGFAISSWQRLQLLAAACDPQCLPNSSTVLGIHHDQPIHVAPLGSAGTTAKHRPSPVLMYLVC